MADGEVTSTAPLGDTKLILTTAPIDNSDEIAYEAQTGGTKKPQKLEDIVLELRKEAKPIFKDLFSTNGIDVWDVPIVVVAEEKWKTQYARQQELESKTLLQTYLKYDCDHFLGMVRSHWKATRYDKDLNPVDPPKELQNCKTITWDNLPYDFKRQYLMQSLRGVGSTIVLAFYSLQDKKIYYQSSVTPDIGVIIHEMAHAYSHKTWQDLLLVLRICGVDAGELWFLNESMAYYIEGFVLAALGKVTDSKHYLSVPESFQDYAKKVIVATGQAAIYRAFFGGSIFFDPNKNEPPKFNPPQEGKAWPDFVWK